MNSGTSTPRHQPRAGFAVILSAGFAVILSAGFAVMLPAGFAVMLPAGFAVMLPAGFAVAAEAETLLDEYFEQADRRGGRENAAALGAEILRRHTDDALVLDTLAWRILTTEPLEHRDLPLAVAAARQAHKVTGGSDREVVETLARALVMSGSRDEGIALHRRAIELSVGDPSTRLVLQEILRGYLEPPPAPGPTDDERLRELERAAAALVATGRAVPVADLLDRADVDPCHVEVLPPWDERLDPEALFERIRPSVVVMAALEPDPETGVDDLTIAAGFCIHESGIIVTNFHVVDIPDATVLVALTADGHVHPVTRLLAVSPFADIAICQLDGARGLPALPCTAGGRPGMRLHTLSHPDGSLWSFTAGILSRSFTVREDGQARTMFTTTADFAVGSSGGPLVDDRGNVVGMVASTLAIYATDEDVRRRRPDVQPADADDPSEAPAAGGDFQMGLNMCVPAADILRLVGERP
jgi:serine protease Do